MSRKPGEIAARLADALIAAGVGPSAVSVAASHKASAGLVARAATVDDFVVVFGVDSRATVEEYRAALREKHSRP